MSANSCRAIPCVDSCTAVTSLVHQKSPVYTQNSPVYTQKSPIYTQNSRIYTQKSPTDIQKSPKYSQKSPTDIQKSPTYTQKSPVIHTCAGLSAGTSPLSLAFFSSLCLCLWMWTLKLLVPLLLTLLYTSQVIRY